MSTDSNKKRPLNIGDKVKVNLDVVSQNGLFESDEQQKQFDYLEAHPMRCLPLPVQQCMRLQPISLIIPWSVQPLFTQKS